MTVRYVNVKTPKRGCKRENGQGRDCVLTGCKSDATVQATRLGGGFRMEVNLCRFHAERSGVTG